MDALLWKIIESENTSLEGTPQITESNFSCQMYSPDKMVQYTLETGPLTACMLNIIAKYFCKQFFIKF